MKKIILLLILSIVALNGNSQTKITTNDNHNLIENYGNKLNLGFGVGYYGFVGHTIPVLHLNYELNVAKDFTLAPFITIYSYQKYHYWGNSNSPYKDYYYRQTVIPIGVKGTYYFDDILQAGSKWDFYLGASLGFAIRKTVWEDGYNGDVNIQNGTSGLYLDGHLGTRYHFSNKTGVFLDLSTGISTIGISLKIH